MYQTLWAFSISLWKWPTKNEASWLVTLRSSLSAPFSLFAGFPGSAVVKNPPAMQETWDTWVTSLGQKTPWRRKWWPTSVFLPGESHGQRSLAGYSPWGHKESDTPENTHMLPVYIFLPVQGRGSFFPEPLNSLSRECRFSHSHLSVFLGHT